MVDVAHWCFLCGSPKVGLTEQCRDCGGWPTSTFRPDVDEDTVKRLHANESIRVSSW